MILGAIVLLVVLAAIGGAVGMSISAWRARDSYDGTKRDWAMTGLSALIATVCLVIGLGVLGIWTGEIDISQNVADGCYRISSTTSSGVGVGVNPKGGVTVIPITTSGRTYTPIACPT